MKARILVVEDDPISQEIIKETLETRGYHVDVVADGFSAIRKVKDNLYDVALVDYNLPDIDGYSSAKMAKMVREGAAPPRIFAVTAQPDRLKSHINEEESPFDGVLPKPFKPDAIIDIVENSLRSDGYRQAVAAADAMWRNCGLAGRPRAVALPLPRLEERIALSIYFELVETADCDLLLATSSSDHIVDIRLRQGFAGVPVVDITDSSVSYADAKFRHEDHATWQRVADVIQAFKIRRDDIKASPADTNASIRLLVYAYLSQRSIEPLRDASKRSYIQYRGGISSKDIADDAEWLVARGLMRKRFVDRFHACGTCGSHRLNVREECINCGSPNLRDTPLIHHFRCAHIGPEEDYIDGPNLVCPKCRLSLRHYGGDYERPGNSLYCNHCRKVNSQPSIAFSCVDCGAHTDGNHTKHDDVFAFDYTEEAVAFLRRPRFPADRLTSDLVTISIDPVALEAIERYATDTGVDFDSFALAEISYVTPDIPGSGLTADQHAEMRRYFLEQVRTLSGEYGKVICGFKSDYLVVDESEISELPGLVTTLLKLCSRSIASEIHPRSRSFLAKNIARLP